jgi:hypothetical protein
MRRARKVEGELSRRLNEAYARWHNKNHSELPHAVGDREQQRRLLGTRERERNDHREVSRGVERRTSENPPSTRFGGLLDDGRIAESQLDELRNMRVLLEEARLLARNLAYHRRARLEAAMRQVLDEVDRQIWELRSEGRG